MKQKRSCDFFGICRIFIAILWDLICMHLLSFFSWVGTFEGRRGCILIRQLIDASSIKCDKHSAVSIQEIQE